MLAVGEAPTVVAMPLFVRALISFLALPFNVTVTVPLVVLWFEGFPALEVTERSALGGAFIAGGLALMAWTIGAFYAIGRGTLAPWDPPTRLVIAGPYRHWRHPMITGVNFVLIGEALITGSMGVALWWLGFLAANAIYLPLVEERDLIRRFGADYLAYMRAVPRWLPRVTPYRV